MNAPWDRPAPFLAQWRLATPEGGVFSGRWALDDERLFAGHYPGSPILPGTFLVEALVQAAAGALGGGLRLAELSSCRFLTPLFPGDEVKAHFTAMRDGEGWVVEAAATGRAEAGSFRLQLAPAAAALTGLPAGPWEQPDAKPLDAAFLRRVLPHRSPMLLLDQALVFGADAPKPTLTGRKAVTLNEPCYAAGEPATWAYPATLVAESFCQACGVLKAASAPPGSTRDPSKVPVLARLVKLRFVGEALPGEVLEHRVRIAARTPDGAVFSGETVVGDRVILQVERVVAATAPKPG